MEGIKTYPVRNNPVEEELMEEEVNKPVSEAANPEVSEKIQTWRKQQP